LLSHRLGPALACVAMLACTAPAKPPPPDSFDRNALLQNVADGLAHPTYVAFADAARALKAAAAALEAAVTATTGEAEASSAARAAWRVAMLAWERAELLQVGPAGSSAARVGGADLRDKIYAWPTVNPCRVDQELVAQSYTTPEFFATSLVDVMGLAAAEYLLFAAAPTNACAASVSINTSGSWAALGEGEVRRRRAAYAAAIADALVGHADALAATWAPGGAFREAWVSAGRGSASFPRAQDAVNELFAALFYMDTEVKDMKLGKPLGLTPDCAKASCPEALEAPRAGLARECLEANLVALVWLFRGHAEGAAGGPGFDDFLIARNGAALAQRLTDTLDTAVATVRAAAPFADVLAGDRAPLVSVYDAVKAITDDLKSQFVTLLDLRVPDEGAADND
jgi:predicted lipoprotein